MSKHVVGIPFTIKHRFHNPLWTSPTLMKEGVATPTIYNSEAKASTKKDADNLASPICLKKN